MPTPGSARLHGRRSRTTDPLYAARRTLPTGVGLLTEVITLGRTLKKRAADELAYFDRPGTSNGPIEAINGRLEHLRGSALGLAQPHTLHHPMPTRGRQLQTHLHPNCEEPD